MFKIIDVQGVTVIVSPMEGFTTMGLGIFVPAGARYEPAEYKGIAHFVEHMLFKGTGKFSYKKIKQDIEGRGGSLNGYTSQETAGYYAQILSKNMKLALDILTDMVVNPLFEKKEIEKERNVILEELKMYNDLPHFRALSLLDGILWEQHPLGEDIIGTEETIHRIGRTELERFKKDFYRPARMCVCCVGNVDERVLPGLLEEKMKGPSVRAGVVSRRPQPLRKRKIVVEQKTIDQTHLCLGFRGVSYRSEYRFVEELLNVVMGANMSSRLFEEVREKRGLCYEISTETRKFSDSGAFVIHCGLDRKNVPAALEAVIRELKRVSLRRVGVRELDRGKDYLLGQLSMTLERPGGRMFYLADSYMSRGEIVPYRRIEEKIRKITGDDLLAFARGLFDFERCCVSCVGNIGPEMREKLENVMIREGK